MSTTVTIPEALKHSFKPRLSEHTVKLVGADTAPNDHPPLFDFVKALGPGDSLGTCLVDFTRTYVGVQQAFDGLLKYPYLERVTAGGRNPFPSQNLRSLLVETNSQFQVYAGQEVPVARGLIGLAEVIPVILAGQTVAKFAAWIGPVVAEYTADLSQKFSTKEADLSQKLALIETLDNTLSDTATQLFQLNQNLSLKNASLQGQVIVHIFREILATCYQLDTVDADVKVQLSVLLTVSGDVIDGKFDDLFADTGAPRLETIMASLSKLQDQLNVIQSNLALLSNSLTLSIEAARALSSVWSHLNDNFPELLGKDIMLTQDVMTAISNEWQDTSTQANDLVGAINGSPTPIKALELDPYSYQFTPSFPGSQNLLTVMKLVEKVQGDPYIYDYKRLRRMRAIVQNPAVRQRLIEKMMAKIELDKEKSRQSKGDANATDDPTPEEQFLTDFGPPAEVTSRLEKLSGDCASITQEFNDILKIPYLDSILVTNPFKTLEFPTSSGSDPEPAQIDVRTMVLRYVTAYQEMQADTIPLIRNLISYSYFQIQLLPAVTTDANPGPGQIALTDYAAANDGIVKEYSDNAAALHLKYLAFAHSWKLAGLSLGKAINESIADITKNKKLIEGLKEEQKKLTLYGALKLIGAAALFAAFPIGGLFAIGGSAALIYFAVKDLENAGKLDEAFENYTIALNSAQATKDKLEPIMEPMNNVTASLQELTNIFNDIATLLGLIKQNMALWDKSPQLFKLLSPKVIVSWQQISDNCDLYIHVINGG